MQNLLWLVKIYHPHLAQFRDNTNFTISDLQNNIKTPNLMNNWHLSKFWVLYSILDVSKGENKKDKFERQQNLDPQPPIKILLPSDLSFLFYIRVIHSRHIWVNLGLISIWISIWFQKRLATACRRSFKLRLCQHTKEARKIPMTQANYRLL